MDTMTREEFIDRYRSGLLGLAVHLWFDHPRETIVVIRPKDNEQSIPKPDEWKRIKAHGEQLSELEDVAEKIDKLLRGMYDALAGKDEPKAEKPAPGPRLAAPR
jgi:hypothetical protein